MDDRSKELYQELVLDHNRSPRNFGSLQEYTHHCVGYNPFCGDKIIVYLYSVENVVENVSFTGEGCAISKAAASMLTQRIKGKSLQEVQSILRVYQQLLDHQELSSTDETLIKDLRIFSGVWQYPTRIKCAALCSRSIQAALQGVTDTTE